MAVTIQEALKEGATWDLDGSENFSSWQGATIEKFQTDRGLAYEMRLHGYWHTAIHKYLSPGASLNVPYWYSGRLPAFLKKPLPTFPRHDPMDDIVSIDDVI
jgi:hypothetical protein